MTVPRKYSRKTLARIAGLCYLVVIATGLFAEVFVRQAVRVSTNAIDVAEKIRASEMLFRFGFMADLLNFVIGLPCVLIIYMLFKHINKRLLQLAIIFVVIQTAVIAVNLLNQFSALLYVTSAAYNNPAEKTELANHAIHALDLQAQGYGIGLVFFGCYCLLVGFIITRANLVPKFLGVLYCITGIAYLANSCTLFLFPVFSNTLFPWFAIPAFLGELSLCLWLLIMGVKEPAKA